MSRLLHCTRCGALYLADRYVPLLLRRWRLCPHCRGPLPPSRAGPVRDDSHPGPLLAEAVP